MEIIYIQRVKGVRMGLIKDLKKTCKDQAAEIRWLKQQKTLLLGRREDLKAKLEREQLREAQLESILGEVIRQTGAEETRVSFDAVMNPTGIVIVTKDDETKELKLRVVETEKREDGL